ncbi:hypothetical protein [Terrisporobacter sp.]
MKLQNLDMYKDNYSDEMIFNNLIKSSDKDLLEYTINVTSDFLNGVILTDEFKLNAKKNLKNYDENEVGELATYMGITPFVQSTISNTQNWQEKATAFLESYIGYIVGTIDKKEFLDNLSEMKSLLNMSDKFYDGLITYFKYEKDFIIENILSRLQF